MGAFHSYDFRGVFNKDFTLKDIYRIGYFLSSVIETSNVLIARDCRESSLEIYNTLIQGVIDSGTDVTLLGLSTTPMLYYAHATNNFTASVQVTASHNDREYNGLKFSGDSLTPIGYHNGLSKLENFTTSYCYSTVPLKSRGKVSSISVTDSYISFLSKYIDSKSSKLNFVIDASNGMASLLARKNFSPSAHYLNDTMDGTFPAHSPNPTDPKNHKEIKKFIVSNKLDLGIMFDGDADRVCFFDEKGNFISPDIIVYFIAEYYYLLYYNQSASITFDVRSSRNVIKSILGNFHYSSLLSKVGRVFMAKALKSNKSFIGGELAGHYYYKDFFGSDSAFLTANIVLSVLSRRAENETLSDMVKKINSSFSTGELNFKIEQKEEAMESIINTIKEDYPDLSYQLLKIDGYRVDFAEWWFSIRKSNTEPYLRLIIEADTKELLTEKSTFIQNILKNFT